MLTVKEWEVMKQWKWDAFEIKKRKKDFILSWCTEIAVSCHHIWTICLISNVFIFYGMKKMGSGECHLFGINVHSFELNKSHLIVKSYCIMYFGYHHIL